MIVALVELLNRFLMPRGLELVMLNPKARANLRVVHTKGESDG